MGNCCRRPAKCAHASSTLFSVQSGFGGSCGSGTCELLE
ncbi:hypothetical protein CK203_046473 [Vitis vinifera]|uniref:Uncharacterized protein n=1 Tax=Vitis vinifera TaxID=29760 RepID=A0A438I290_VITVI|nr:hypothetical protein CK203_046473 [Vitis vinifera]